MAAARPGEQDHGEHGFDEGEAALAARTTNPPQRRQGTRLDHHIATHIDRRM